MQHNTFTLQQASPTVKRPGGLGYYLKKLSAVALVLLGAGITQQAWGQSAAITDDAITLSYKTTTSTSPTSQNFAGGNNNTPYTTYARLAKSNSSSAMPPDLGTYDLNGNSNITLTNAMLQGAVTANNTMVTATRLQYRIYLQGTAAASIPSYSNLTLTTTQNSTSLFSSFNASGTANIDLLTGLTSGGTYIIDIRAQADIKDTQSSNTDVATDPQGGAYYYATFYVTPPTTTPPNGTTTWQGVARGTTVGGTVTPLASDRDWLNTANWTNGVPTRFSDAIIPERSGSNTVYPLLNSLSATYEVRNLTLQGAQGETSASVTIGIATLSVYGNISQESDPGLVGNTFGNQGVTDPTQNSTLILAGADQVITGNIIIADLIVAGSGTKSVLTPITSSNIIAFEPSSPTAGVILQSAIQRSNNSTPETFFSTNGRAYVQLLSTSQISTATDQAETKVSFIKGVSRADRQLASGQRNTFGNIGLEITPNHDINNLILYRVVGAALTGPVSSTAVPIKRSYQLTGDDNSNTPAYASSALDVVFHYLDSGRTSNANELNGIDESNLTMFRTVNNGAPYQALGGTVNTDANTVTRLSIPSLQDYKLTLGDRTNPLPVTIAAFAATRSGDKALVTWTTATEEHNAGFNVQVSTDGATFRTLSFVESKVVNSVQAQNYSYTDVESGKTGIRYYRLEQVDQDGTKSYSPVKAVSFSGTAATSLALVASPNPFNGELSLSFDGLSTPDGTVRVRIMDMTGRTIRDQQSTMTGASVTLSDLSALQSGLYLAKVTLADGTTKTVRVQRQ